jgi:hypothetical protein
VRQTQDTGPAGTVVGVIHELAETVEESNHCVVESAVLEETAKGDVARSIPGAANVGGGENQMVN